MEFNEFCDYVRKNIGEYLPEYFDIEAFVRDIKKNNGTTYRALCMRDEDIGDCLSNIYLESYYRAYMDRMDIERVMEDIAEEYRNSRSQILDKGISKDIFEAPKIESIIPRIVNYEKNKEQLENCPYIMYQDLAITFRVLIHVDQGQMMSALLNNQAFEAMEISMEELKERAMENYEKILPSKIRTLGSVLAGMMDDMPNFAYDEPPADHNIYVVTNVHGINGATSIILDSIRQQAADMIGGNFYVIPSSVHECLLVPENSRVSPEELCDMVSEVNRTVVSEDEVLSDSVYHCDAKTLELTMCNDSKNLSKDKESNISEDKRIDEDLDDIPFSSKRSI